LQSQFNFDYNIEEEQQRYKEYRDILKDMITDTGVLISEALRQEKTVLCEGANAALLDIDHGTYPYVTSSSTTA